MKFKAILWIFGATVTVTGLIFGLRSAAKAVGIDYDGNYQMYRPLPPDEQRARYPQLADNSFSPDAFRDELLK